MYAADYQWDLVNALVSRDFQRIESIITENVDTMSPYDRRLVISFTLMYSRGENTVRVFELLQRYNIRPTAFDVYTAISRNQPDDVIRVLLRYGAQANGEILLLAMEKQRFDLARQFIESGVDVNYQYPLSRTYADGMTPLLYAARWGNLDLARLLVERGANINARAKDGSTALAMARSNGNTPMYDYLAGRGASETPGGTVPPPPQNAGIMSILDNQVADFQAGTYRLFGGNVDIRFSGNKNSGSIHYTRGGRANTGAYRIEGNTMTLTMEGRSFVYNLDSNMSFSGSGEIWVRIGN